MLAFFSPFFWDINIELLRSGITWAFSLFSDEGGFFFFVLFRFVFGISVT